MTEQQLPGRTTTVKHKALAHNQTEQLETDDWQFGI